MQFRLRTLVLLTAIGPPLLAAFYWVAQWLGGNPIALGVGLLIALFAVFVFGLIAWYHELQYMIGGPSASQSWRRKQRRRIRVRIERYAGGST
jgi:Zn-dependent protease with chaperone function